MAVKKQTHPLFMTVWFAFQELHISRKVLGVSHASKQGCLPSLVIKGDGVQRCGQAETSHKELALGTAGEHTCDWLFRLKFLQNRFHSCTHKHISFQKFIKMELRMNYLDVKIQLSLYLRISQKVYIKCILQKMHKFHKAPNKLALKLFHFPTNFWRSLCFSGPEEAGFAFTFVTAVGHPV